MAPSRQRQAWSHRLLWVLSLCLALVSPAAVWADLYTWVDDRGVQNIVDDPTLIPERFRRQARLFVTSSASRGTESMRAAVVPPSREDSPAPAASETQGSVAVALAERLALVHPAVSSVEPRPTPLQAVNALLERGILPPAGWMLDEPIDPGWMADLARSLLAASSAGRLLQTPESALRTLEGVAAERGIAVVAFEPPPPPQPQVIVTQPAAVIVETVFVPAFPLHTGHLVHHPHFGKRFFTDHPHLWQHFPKNHGAGQHHHHPLNLRPGPPAIRFDGAHRGGKIAEFPPVGSHSVQSGSTVLTTGGREKRSGATRCASSSIGRSVRICP